jgi:8-oxo-dGTP pyrophosphatase MutT (NUDIX family)
LQEFQYADDGGVQWRLTFGAGKDGIVMCQDRGVGLGAVLVLTNPEKPECLMVRKAQRPGYEFSGMWAFPGGMVRLAGDTPKPLQEIVLDSLRDRVRAETGLSLAPLAGNRNQPPLVTGYLAKGQRRYTLVVPFELPTERAKEILNAPISSHDSSVTAVAWIDPRSKWNRIAPANRVFAAATLWPILSEEERRAAQFEVEQALKLLNEWSKEVQLHHSSLHCYLRG